MVNAQHMAATVPNTKETGKALSRIFFILLMGKGSFFACYQRFILHRSNTSLPSPIKLPFNPVTL